MSMEQELYMDVVLVPAGVLLLLLYHIRLLYLVYYFPSSTVIGVNQTNRELWVRAMMADGLKHGVLAVQTLRNNIMASTLLATAAIMLCSLIAVLASNNGSSNFNQIFGERNEITLSVKLLSVFICFIVAFFCNVQSVRYYSHVSFLINISYQECTLVSTPEYVSKVMLRGGQFWSLGLRAFYLSIPMFLWLFGPIPMFASSVIMSAVFHSLDTVKGFQQTSSISSQKDIEAGGMNQAVEQPFS